MHKKCSVSFSGVSSESASKVARKVDEEDEADHGIVQQTEDPNNRLREDIQGWNYVEEDKEREDDEAQTQKPRDALTLTVEQSAHTVAHQGGQIFQLVEPLRRIKTN